ncbi:glutamine amidotransferase [Bosea sp. Root381]|uniref:glutamine amidotransferase n=1 Tax=Bosea sp. Root381 TaxID=1736524 RepID=UPI0007013CF0|nr:glutamine amidotransferase [Bosea sp. Root381]KRE05804.1 glutamine amidotransferase [Bosea sp. Root381]
MTRTCLALRHVHFEDLGTFAAPLAQAGYSLAYSDVGEPDFCAGDPLAPDLLVVLGGPVGVYEEQAYPFLARERTFIATRLAAGLPTLGICLGAQLVAAALGSRIFPTGIKEIGFAALTLTAQGEASPLRHLAGIPVLHWHGDTYALPPGAQNLASSSMVEQQAFAIGSNVLALQFHPEAGLAKAEQWLVGHAAELAAAEIDLARLRQDWTQRGHDLATAAEAVVGEWLAQLNQGK